MGKESSELLDWFDGEGLTRRLVTGDASGAITESVRGPVVALGPADDDFALAPDPAESHWPGKPLAEMTLDDYNVFMFRWFEAAVGAGAVRCANCGKPIAAGDDLPDPETWDALFVEKELVAWMLAHFDCKRWLAKRLKGLQPFELSAHEPPRFDLSLLTPDQTERHVDVSELD